MNLIKKETYLYLKVESPSQMSFNTNLSIPKLSTDVIIDFSSIVSLEELNLYSFLKINQFIISKGFCLVVVLKANISNVKLEPLNIVPSLIEAEDYINMEQIQRDLGI